MITIRGRATVKVLDRDGDIIDPMGIQYDNYLAAGGAVLQNHDTNRVIGKTTKIEKTADSLIIEANIFDETVERVILEGALKSFSIRGRILDEDYSQKNGRIVKSLDLYEVSVVTIPANPKATFEILKSAESGSDAVVLTGEFEKVAEDIQIIAKEAKMENIEKIETKAIETKEAQTNLDAIEKSITQTYEKLAEVLGASAKEVNEAVTKKMDEIEKAVSTMFDGFATQSTAGVVQDVPGSKVFYSAGVVLEPMPSTLVNVPVIGMATVTGEGVATDSNVSEYIAVTAKQFTAKYPITYFLETAGGQNLLNAIEQNIKASIARKFDEVAVTKATGFYAEALSEAESITGTWEDAKSLYAEILTNAASRGVDISEPSEWNLYITPVAFAALASDNNLLTVDKMGDKALLVTGQVGTLFGMRVFVVPAAGDVVYAVNRKYIATGAFGGWNYERGLDANGNTMIFGRKLLGFGAYLNGVLKITKE